MKPRTLLAHLLFLLLTVSVSAIAQQPTILADGVRNGASYALGGMPNAGIAQGSIMVIFGDNLGPASLVQVSAFPLPTAPPGLAGTSVRVTVGGTQVQCIMLYTLKTQVAAVLPSGTPLGAGTLTVTYNGQTSAAAPITVVARSFGIFALNQAGSGPGVIQNFNSSADQPFNAVSVPSRPGQVETLWGTGIGAVSGNEAAGALPGDMPNVNLHVWVGGRDAQVQYRGRSGCCVGVDQIVFVVPAGVEGCYVPVAVQIDSIISNYVSISIAASGSACTDPTGYTPAEVSGVLSRGSLSIGSVNLTRLSFSITEPGFPPIDFKTDSGSALFTKLTTDQFLHSQGICVPPAINTCMVRTFSAGSEASDPVTGTPLNAGPVINVSGPKGARQLTPALTPGFYSGTLSGPLNPFGGDNGYLDPGNYTVNDGSGASGTNSVGPFQANYVVPSPLVWTNKDAIVSVNRSQGVQVNWSGGAAGSFVGIYGSSTNAANTAGASFVCFADASVGAFTVPPAVMLAMPVSSANPQDSSSFLAVGSINPAVRFSAAGLDIGIVNSSVQTAKTVPYQ